jgi:outer membrane receptor protein involved in Fe transport
MIAVSDPDKGFPPVGQFSKNGRGGGNPDSLDARMLSSLSFIYSSTKMKLPPLLLFLFMLGNCSVCLAQHSVTGRVVDEATGEPMELTVVRVLRTGKEELTDRQGRFAPLKTTGDSMWIEVSCVGYRTRRLLITAGAQGPVIPLERSALDLRSVTITGHAGLHSFHTLSRIDLDMQPARSAQDLLRLVPGLFIAQHQGGGKAEQIFLRGFDADHGTDVNISVDGMPVNMVSHAHGQGYADLHFLIPETVAGYDFGKGPYNTEKGDLATAGYVAYSTINAPDRNMIRIEGGQFNTGRTAALVSLLSDKAKKKGQNAYIAADGLYSDGGPFTVPEHFKRINLFGKFNTQLGANSKLSLSLGTMSSQWRAAGEIPNRAVAEDYLKNRWGALDSAQGGSTSRTNVNARLTTFLANGWTLENQGWYSHYDFNLISNFTFFYYYPTTGDEFRQHEIRDMAGTNTRISKTFTIGNTAIVSAAGIGSRYDHIDPSELDHSMNGIVLAPLQLGRTRETSVFGYADETVEHGKWLFNAGVRVDYFHFFYENLAPVSDTFARRLYNGLDPKAQKAIISPKLNIQYTFNDRMQVYFKSGKGFHSNDARVVIANQGFEILPAAYGADLGMNWKPLPRLFVNTALWYLYLQQEFTFGQDLIDQPGGPVQPSGRTRRFGIDLSGRYQLTDWLFAFLNLNFARPRFIDSAAGHRYLPLAPTFTSTAGLDLRLNNGLNGSLSYRWLHDRAANSTYSLTAVGYCVADLTVNYTRKKYEVGLAVENLFNATWNESQFGYVSRLKNEARPVDEVSYTPGVPFFARVKFTVFF